MRIITLAKRNLLEIIRDPITFVFSIILPVFLLFIFQQFDIPSDIYNINNFAPSTVVFGFAFISLFTASLISKDRSTSLLSRLYASPLKSHEYILGYTLALLPVAIFQSILFFIVAVILGLTFSINTIITILVLIPLSILFISLGLLIGCLVNDKAAPGVGSVVVQLVAFTSGMYFDINMLGGTIKVISNILPFRYVVDISRAALSGNLLEMKPEILIIIIYIIVISILSAIVFKKSMIKDNK